MIHWKDLEKSRSDAFKARWRSNACKFARLNADGTCMGCSQGEDDEPVDICKAKGKVPPVKHGDLELAYIRAARRWNNAMHWSQDGRPKDWEAYMWADGVKRKEAES